MTTDFYDGVAKRFGAYHTGARHTTEYLNGEPEKIFEERLIELSGKDKVALDVGCADGRFTLSVAPYFEKIVGIDLSRGMLDVARKFQGEQPVKNVSFEEQDASITLYPDGVFDLVYSRRGPTYFTEIRRLLRDKGNFVWIDIGEKDCQAIKEVFGRGQGFGNWNLSRLVKDRQELSQAGFQIEFAKDYSYDEYYASYDDLGLFLQGVPIFEDFDPEKDKKSLQDYVAQFKSEKGIKLPRHRIVVIAHKV